MPFSLKKFFAGIPSAQLYVFGKHPAWRDFMDVGQLPPIPAQLWHFHHQARPAIESDFGSIRCPDLSLIWWRGKWAQVVFALNSHDAPNPQTGHSRTSPLFIGFSLRNRTPDLLTTAVNELDSLAADLQAPDISQPQFLDRVRIALALFSRAEFDLHSGEPRQIQATNLLRIERLQFVLRTRRKSKHAAFRLRLSDDGSGPMSLSDWIDLAAHHSLTNRPFQLLAVRDTQVAFVLSEPLSRFTRSNVKRILRRAVRGADADRPLA